MRSCALRTEFVDEQRVESFRIDEHLDRAVEIPASVGFLDLAQDRLRIEVVWIAVEHIAAKGGPLIIGEAQDGLVDRGRLIVAWQIFGRNRPIAPEKLLGKRQGISHAILLSEARNGL